LKHWKGSWKRTGREGRGGLELSRGDRGLHVSTKKVCRLRDRRGTSKNGEDGGRPPQNRAKIGQKAAIMRKRRDSCRKQGNIGLNAAGEESAEQRPMIAKINRRPSRKFVVEPAGGGGNRAEKTIVKKRDRGRTKERQTTLGGSENAWDKKLILEDGEGVIRRAGRGGDKKKYAQQKAMLSNLV